MYSCYEIKIIFARCNTVSEVFKASDALDYIIEQKGLTAEQERFSKREAVVRHRQIKSINRKN